MQWIDRAYKVRLEPTEEQIDLFHKWYGVRKFAYNDCLREEERKYAYKLICGEREVKSVFDLRRIARHVECKDTYKEDANTKEWVFTLVDQRTGETIDLKQFTDQAKGKHPNPARGFEFLTARKDRFKEVKELTFSEKRNRPEFAFILEAPALIFREASGGQKGDAGKAFKNFFKGNAKYPRFDNGSKKHFRMEPGGAKELGKVEENESDIDAIISSFRKSQFQSKARIGMPV